MIKILLENLLLINITYLEYHLYEVIIVHCVKGICMHLNVFVCDGCNFRIHSWP